MATKSRPRSVGSGTLRRRPLCSPGYSSSRRTRTSLPTTNFMHATYASSVEIAHPMLTLRGKARRRCTQERSRFSKREPLRSAQAPLFNAPLKDLTALKRTPPGPSARRSNAHTRPRAPLGRARSDPTRLRCIVVATYCVKAQDESTWPVFADIREARIRPRPQDRQASLGRRHDDRATTVGRDTARPVNV
jgi:hypothetical protein